MLLKISAAAAALIAASALAGAASAQSTTNPATSADQSTGSVQTDNGAAQPTSALNGPGPAPSSTATPPATDTTGYNVGAPQTDPNTGAQIVTNGPVPDTKANRARFGAPDSHAGRRTSPAGN
jgi:hypothetical protein